MQRPGELRCRASLLMRICRREVAQVPRLVECGERLLERRFTQQLDRNVRGDEIVDLLARLNDVRNWAPCAALQRDDACRVDAIGGIVAAAAQADVDMLGTEREAARITIEANIDSDLEIAVGTQRMRLGVAQPQQAIGGAQRVRMRQTANDDLAGLEIDYLARAARCALVTAMGEIGR